MSLVPPYQSPGWHNNYQGKIFDPMSSYYDSHRYMPVPSGPPARSPIVREVVEVPQSYWITLLCTIAAVAVAAFVIGLIGKHHINHNLHHAALPAGVKELGTADYWTPKGMKSPTDVCGTTYDTVSAGNGGWVVRCTDSQSWGQPVQHDPPMPWGLYGEVSGIVLGAEFLFGFALGTKLEKDAKDRYERAVLARQIEDREQDLQIGAKHGD